MKIHVNIGIVKNYLLDNDLTIKKFCKLCNIKYYNYRQLALGHGKIKIEVVYKMCKTIGIKSKDLLGI